MKKLITLLSAAFAFAIAAPTEAQAGHEDHGCSHQREVGHCGHCHQPIMSVQQYVGRDCHGCPVYRWVTIRHTHCERAAYHERHRGHDHGYQERGYSGRGYSDRGYSDRGYSAPRPPLPHEVIGRIFGRR